MKLTLLLACTALVAVSGPLNAAYAATAPAVVAATTTFEALTIAPGQIPAAPEGKVLTLTVDGIERPLAPGTYQGDVALSVTDDIPVQYAKLPTHHFRTALYVENGAPVWSRSVKPALGGGTAGEGRADNLVIRSNTENFNGVLVTGSGKYVIDHPVIDLTGNGGNDFAGFGAGIAALGKSEVIVERPIIRTTGAIRAALFTGDDAVMRINNAEIETFNGKLPQGYKFTVDVGRMMEVPWMLGLAGNVRSSNLVGRGTLYITNSHIRSQGWGALSTDDPQHVRMYVKDSFVELTEGGYGTYSIGNSLNVFEHSLIRSPDIGAVMAAEGSLTLTDRTIVEAGTYGVMMHSNVGGGTLTIDKGSQVHAGRAAIEVKGVGTTIVVDDAQVTSGGGIILQAMENDDPFMRALMRGELPEGMDAFPPGMSPDAGKRKGPLPDVAIGATFRNTRLVGDFWNGRTAEGSMNLTFENASVTGRISTSTTAPESGKDPVRATYREIGHVANTAAPTTTAFGASVKLGVQAHWTVTGTSYLTALTIDPSAQLDAGAGKVVLSVNGKTVPVRAGTYKGKIVVAVKP